MKRLAALAALPLVALTGCAAFTDDGASSADGVQVTAAFYPLQYVADRVAGDHAEVDNLTAPGGEPHDLELNPKETADVARADLVVFQRGFQPAVDDAVDANASGEVLDVADVVDLVPFRDHGVDSDEDDPHFWQDPLLLADVGDAVADRLATVDPTTPTTTRRTRQTCAPTSSSSTRSTPPGCRAASATRSSSATTPSATSSGTA